MIGERKMKRNSLRAYLSCNSVFSQRGLVMKSSTMKRARVAVMLFLAVTLTSASWAAGYKGGVPWQVGDVIICFGSGTCNVVRINGATVTLLDQFSDGLSGETRGV